LYSSSIRKLEANTSTTSAKLDAVIFLITQFLQSSPISSALVSCDDPKRARQSEASINIEDWTTFAGKLVSSNESLVPAAKSEKQQSVTTPTHDTLAPPYEPDSNFRRQSLFSNDPELEQVQDFFHQRWGDQEDKYLQQLELKPWRTPTDHPDYKFIPYLRNRASEAFEAQNYKVAKSSLLKILDRSPKLYGPHYEWRDDTIRMLVISCVRSGDWEEAERHMGKSFMERDQTLEDLAMDFFSSGKRNEATRICLAVPFKERVKVLQRLARSYLRDNKWKEAKSVLSELLYREQPSEDVRLDWLYSLAEVYLELKDLERAKKCALSVYEARAKVLGDGHALYYEALSLLVKICEKQGDGDCCGFYQDLLRSDSHSTFPVEEKLIPQHDRKSNN
jgi:tetratricopeptide (TPR) repeat protein